MPGGLELGKHRAKSRCLCWACDDWKTCRVGSELAQQLITGTTTHQVQLLGTPARDRGKVIDTAGIACRKGLQHGSDELALRGWSPCPLSSQRLSDTFNHPAWGYKTGIIWVNHDSE